MPEIWVPFGSVEALVTIQAENLGAVIQSDPETGNVEIERYSQLAGKASALYICDSAPTTIELLHDLAPGIGAAANLKVMSAAPKRVESSVSELKGKVTTLPPPLPADQGEGTVYAHPLSEPGPKIFIGTGRPDPLFGMVDSKVSACLNWVSQSHGEAARARKDMEPTPFTKTGAYEKMEELARDIKEATFLTVVPRGGKLRSVMENAPFDAIKNGFAEATVPPAKALVVGPGGKGFDDTLSSSLRGVWSALPAVRKAGAVLLVAECSEGLGSTALEMVATGRISGEPGRRR